MNDSILIPALMIVSVCATLVVVISTTLYVRLNRKYLLLSNENKKLKQSSEQEAQQILDTAREHAEAIIKNADLEAQKVISESKSFGSELQQHAVQATEELLNKQEKVVEQVVGDVQKSGIEAINQANESFTKLTATNLENMQTHLEADFKKEHDAVANEIELYKKAQIESINKSVGELMERTLMEVLGKSLTKADHEELIKRALQSLSHEYGL